MFVLLMSSFGFFSSACSTQTSSPYNSVDIKTIPLHAITGDTASGLAESLQRAFDHAKLTSQTFAIPRGTTPGSLQSTASATANRTDTDDLLMEDGYLSSSSSEFAISTRSDGIVGEMGFLIIYFESAKNAERYLDQWQGSAVVDKLPGVVDIPSQVTGKCVKGRSDCDLSGFLISKGNTIVTGTVYCSIDCTDISKKVGASLYPSLSRS
jgi:hypothetical protein